MHRVGLARTTVAGRSAAAWNGLFYNNWSAKNEYLYIDFGDGPAVATSPTFSFVSGRLTDNIVRVGLNYKFY